MYPWTATRWTKNRSRDQRHRCQPRHWENGSRSDQTSDVPGQNAGGGFVGVTLGPPTKCRWKWCVYFLLVDIIWGLDKDAIWEMRLRWYRNIGDMGDLGTNQWPCDLMEDQRMMYHQFLMWKCSNMKVKIDAILRKKQFLKKCQEYFFSISIIIPRHLSGS